jgi:DNA (cytosine-5)-methyltransferase 1
MSGALYNEIEPYAVQWLRNLERAGHIAPGRVEHRSITELTPADVAGVTQAHYFAGIGIWSHALRLAGWPDSLPVWTGSCPCQPFSTAGQRKGFDDSRHLWPEWFRLIRECRPSVVLGEQVASKDGLDWLDAVFADLEGAGYACAAFDICAAGVGAPHIRQRLYFAAVRLDGLAHHHHHQQGCVQQRPHGPGAEFAPRSDIDGRGEDGGLGHADSQHAGRDSGAAPSAQGGAGLRAVGDESGAPGTSGRLGEPSSTRPQGRERPGDVELRGGTQSHGPAATSGFWCDVEWLPCRDGKQRPTQPGLFPLAHGAASRMGRLRAYGNGLVAPLAAEFCRAVLDSLREGFLP